MVTPHRAMYGVLSQHPATSASEVIGLALRSVALPCGECFSASSQPFKQELTLRQPIQARLRMILFYSSTAVALAARQRSSQLAERRRCGAETTLPEVRLDPASIEHAVQSGLRVAVAELRRAFGLP